MLGTVVGMKTPHITKPPAETRLLNQMNSGAGSFVVLVICCGYSFEIAIWSLSCQGKPFNCVKMLNLHLCRADPTPKCHT